MDYIAIPPAKEIAGEITAPPSKSATNRALVLAALSAEPVEIVRPLESEDTVALERCLAAMGARIERRGDCLVVGGPLKTSADREVPLDAGESGTAARFLAALCAVTPGRFLLTGSARLRQRPMKELVEALIVLGASIDFRGESGFLPIVIQGRPLSGRRVEVDASRSSQFLSALLLAGVGLPEGLEVEAAGAVASAPYVAMTVEILRAFGHSVREGPRFFVSRGAQAIRRYEVAGDYSSAVPYFAAVGVAGGRVLAKGLSWPAPDADARALPVLQSMGLSIDARPEAISAARTMSLRPVHVRATEFPDSVPALAALAAFAPGDSRFEGIRHLKLKESDRIEALTRLLTSAGGKAEAEGDALVVHGPIECRRSSLRRLPTANDHRIAMAGALLSLRVPDLLIENPASVAKSHPMFFRDLERIVKRET